MRRWMAAPLVFAAAAALALDGGVPEARAQNPAPVAATFITADGVKLHSLFHKSPKGGQGDPVVVFLYTPGVDRNMTKGDWDGLANRLNAEGFHVLRFDWRGHGKSTDITDPQTFWTNGFTGPWNNQYIKGANKKPLKNDVFVKTDFTPVNLDKYFPVFVTDLAAVRMHLDQMNDEGSLNTSSIYVIGAGDAASLGLLWMAAEWLRPSVHPTLPGGVQYKVVPTPGVVVDPEAGRDFAGAIWLSGSRAPAIPPNAAQAWIRDNLRMRENNPMLLLYGPEDKKAAEAAKFFYDEVLVAKGNKAKGVKPLEQTFLKPLEEAKALNGVNLLGNNAQLKTEDTIVKYMAAIQKERQTLVRTQRKYVSPYFIDLRYFGLAPR